MNSLFAFLGIESVKPILTALLLPPVPFLILMLVGARLILPRRGWGWLVIVLSVVGMWLSTTSGTGRLMEQFMVQVPSVLPTSRVGEMKADSKTAQTTAIVVLGGGMEPFAPEYGANNLAAYSLERLRYGVWLGRETGAPVAFSGGVGWSQPTGASEAEAAARIAEQDFQRPLRWVEGKSRDTRENATLTVPLLKSAGVNHILLVTHGWHMPRAKRAFDEAAASQGLTVEAAPMGLAPRVERPALEWLPSALGFTRVRNALRESFGRLMGA